MLEEREFYIDGRWVSPVAANDLHVIDPSSEEPCAVISLGGPADTDAAVSAAKAAFEGWSVTPKAERVALVRLSGHPDVDMISFTGSTRAGIAISKNAADSLKRVSLELGGKGANLTVSPTTCRVPTASVATGSAAGCAPAWWR